MKTKFYEKVYAGVVGKLVGVYLGRPIENIINYKKLIKKVGIVEDYVNDALNIPLLVTDDDIGGTFTFCKSLRGGTLPTPKQIGEAWLNYLIEHKTILWWGGLGCSTEHTAYLRLKNGFIPPESGSIKLNSQGVAEQIGSQIFIDGWAMFAAGNPDLAVEIAKRAACVSHDGEALHAAVVVAAIEALAFIENDIQVIIKRALTYIPEDSEIYKLIMDIVAFHKTEKDWLVAREYIENKYGYSKFPGSCHVIPNHAIIILSMLYSEGNFSKALSIVVTSGWDTDCNGGNVGCIMGILAGLEGINEKEWRDPIRDICYLPSAEPGTGIGDAVSIAYDIINCSNRYEGKAEVTPKNGSRYHFEMPDSLQGFCLDAGDSITYNSSLKNVEKNSKYGTHTLNFTYSAIAEKPVANLGVKTFIPPDAKVMVNYDFITSPDLYSGQTVKIGLYAGNNKNSVSFRQYAKYYGVNDEIGTIYGSYQNLDSNNYGEFEWTLDCGNPFTFFETGLELYPSEDENNIYLDYLKWDGEPNYTVMNPKKLGEMAIRSWISNINHYPNRWSADDFLFAHDFDKGLHFTGSMLWKNYEFESTISAQYAEEFGVIVRAQGMTRYLALLIADKGLNIVQKYDSEVISTIVPYEYSENKKLNVKVKVYNDIMSCEINGETIVCQKIDLAQLDKGGCGFLCSQGTMSVNGVKFSPSTELSV